jgi:hypothetical protein
MMKVPPLDADHGLLIVVAAAAAALNADHGLLIVAAAALNADHGQDHAQKAPPPPRLSADHGQDHAQKAPPPPPRLNADHGQDHAQKAPPPPRLSADHGQDHATQQLAPLRNAFLVQGPGLQQLQMPGKKNRLLSTTTDLLHGLILPTNKIQATMMNMTEKREAIAMTALLVTTAVHQAAVLALALALMMMNITKKRQLRIKKTLMWLLLTVSSKSALPLLEWLLVDLYMPF